MNYANVILPLPFDRAFTYSIPAEMEDAVCTGARVLVPFGQKKYYTALVESVTPIKPESSFAIKDIACVIDQTPIIRYPQLKFWQWMADYYLCPIGDVFKAALPSGLKPGSETVVEINPEIDLENLKPDNDIESRILELVNRKQRVTVKEISSALDIDKVEIYINNMMSREWLIVSERIAERFRSKRVKYVELADESAKAFDAVKSAKKQEMLLMALIAMSNHGRNEVEIGLLLERCGATRAILKSLVDKGIARIIEREVSRFSYTGKPVSELPMLSDAQSAALTQIHHSLLDHQVTLLHGVTSSGKTEIYIHLIDFVLKQGKQALFLVPEIALTTQLTERLQRVFGDKVVIYHSKFSDNQRVEVWQKLLKSHEPCVVIGARSSVFLPFAQLGLVIVDEEHESSFKQYDPAPRYNGRDSAIMLAAMHDAKVVLGSATPSIETYYKATNGKYGLVSLTTRYDDVALPKIEVVDLSRERLKGRVIGSFAQTTVEETHRSLNAGKQAIFFHNRRGYAPMARCKACAFVPKCDHCDVSLTYHRNPEALVCHYCGASYPVMRVCPACGEPAIEIVGYGTERIEDEVASLFPGSNIMRMDLDTTRNKDSYSKIISDFSNHKADILVGTQMVTKGLDFADVDIVAVINADSIIHYPDFRSAERAFNMLEQVSGRAGRRDATGRVIIQTREPQHNIIKYVSNHDYKSFYDSEIKERQAFAYPPFSRVINIYIKHRDLRQLITFADNYGRRLRELFGNRVNGPKEPHVARIQSQYIREIMLKIETEASIAKVKKILRDLYIEVQSSPSTKGFTIYYDVDPA